MGLFRREKPKPKVDTQVVDRLEDVTKRLESFAERLERELNEIKQEERSRG